MFHYGGLGMFDSCWYFDSLNIVHFPLFLKYYFTNPVSSIGYGEAFKILRHHLIRFC
jgi:hypothetical protein